MKRVIMMLAIIPITTATAQNYYSYGLYKNGEYEPPDYQHLISDRKLVSQLEIEFNRPTIGIKVKKEEERPIPLSVIYFEYNSYKVKDEYIKKIKEIEGEVVLQGYASPEGSDKYNYNLSIKRAKSVKRYIKGKVDKVMGYGEEMCNLPKERWKECRKVEIYKK